MVSYIFVSIGLFLASGFWRMEKWVLAEENKFFL